MPPKNLPQHAQDIYKAAEKSAKTNTCKDSPNVDECAAKVAWSAVKNKYHKSKDGTWVPNSTAEFSLAVKRAAYDKASNEMRWRADTSDTEEDSFGDSMSLELYHDFLDRINSGEQAPEEFQTEFWSGGLPYVPLSHYRNQKAVVGQTKNVYIDGNFLKAKGTLDNTPQGRKVFEQLNAELYGDQQDRPDKIRISIAFLDWMHKHKSNGYMFERKSLDDVCPECIKEFIAKKYGGKIYLRGQLVQLAPTRVPVNKRTLMEVERSMTTRKEDAASIVDDELAEEMEQEELSLVGKSEALVVKSDEDEIVEECSDCGDETEPVVVEEAELEEKAVMKKDGGCSHPASHYLIVGDPKQVTTWHLKVKNCQGQVDHGLMGAAYAALTKGYRGNKYSGPDAGAAMSKLKGMYKSHGWPLPSKADLEEMSKATSTVEDRLTFIENSLGEIMDKLNPKQEETPNQEQHILDTVFSEVKSVFDEVAKSDISEEEKLRKLQPVYEKLGVTIQKSIIGEPEQADVTDPVIKLSSVVDKLAGSVDMLYAKVDQMAKKSDTTQPATNWTPQRRSFAPPLQTESAEVAPQVSSGVQRSKTPNLRRLIERTT